MRKVVMYNFFALCEPEKSPIEPEVSNDCPGFALINNDGNQGMVITAESLGYTGNKCIKIFKKEPDSSVKWLNRVEIYQKLREVDTDQTRFLIPEIINVSDHLKCLGRYFGEVQSTATIFDILVKLDHPRNMSRKAYRFLRKSIDILAEIGVVHGDLPGNVMRHPSSNMPIIIDFDISYTATPTEIKKESFDRRAFLNNFKAVKRKT